MISVWYGARSVYITHQHLHINIKLMLHTMMLLDGWLTKKEGHYVQTEKKLTLIYKFYLSYVYNGI